MKPEDILADGVDTTTVNGMEIRKGSVAAFLANAHVVVDPRASVADREQAERDIVALLPALKALRIFDVFEIRDAKLRAFVDAH